MKRGVCLILTLLLLFTGCSRNAETAPVHPVTFYYCGVPGEYSSAAVLPEVRDAGSDGMDLQALLTMYLQGPQSEGLYAPFPAETAVEDLRIEDQVAYVTFNDGYSSLTGVALTMANACLVYTLTQFDDIDGVCIRTTGAMLTEQLSVVLTRDDFLVEDDTEQGDLQTVKLYFPDESGCWLQQESRTAALDTDSELLLYLMQQLLAGPHNNSLQALPDGTELLDLHVTDQICTVDFSEAFWENRPQDPLEARLMILSVVNTLTELQNIRQVRLLCQGAPVTEWAGLSLEPTLVRDETAIRRQRTGESIDADLYVAGCGTELLFRVPCQLPSDPLQTRAAQVLQTLVQLKPVNGYINPIPADAAILELDVRKGLCIVEFDSSFVQFDTKAEAEQAVRAVVMTLCSLEEIEAVKIIIRNASLPQVDLTQPLTADAAWVAK